MPRKTKKLLPCKHKPKLDNSTKQSKRRKKQKNPKSSDPIISGSNGSKQWTDEESLKCIKSLIRGGYHIEGIGKENRLRAGILDYYKTATIPAYITKADENKQYEKFRQRVKNRYETCRL